MKVANQKLIRVISLLFLAALWAIPGASAQIMTTVAGGFVGDGRKATQASFQAPHAVTLDRHHNAYITDLYTHRIRKVTPSGTITTYAGTGIAGYNGDGIPASSATLNWPTEITLDPAGNIVFADSWNARVRKIDITTAIISTIAGNGVFGNTGDGGPATQAGLERPWGVIYDSAGNLYISDSAACVVRVVNSQGIITTFAGTGKRGSGGDGGPAIQAQFDQPKGLALDTDGDLDISDYANHLVRQVNAAGIISTIAGNGKIGFSGDGGPATQAAINTPEGLAYQGGILYIAGNTGMDHVRMVSSGIINTFAGSTPGYDGDHHGPLDTQFQSPGGVLPISATNVVVADRVNTRVRELKGGLVKTVAGGYIGDGRVATSAALVLPHNIAFDTGGNLYIADPAGNRVRKVNTRGKISTVAGNSITGNTGDGGPATLAEVNFPFAVAVDSTGNIFIADTRDSLIRKVDPAGTITTFVASPNFSNLQGLGVDTSGNLFAADAAACVVWEITPSAVVNIVAGVPGQCGYNGDGIGATAAQLNGLQGVAADALGNLYIADSVNNRIRMVDPAGLISTVTGDGKCGFSGDGGIATSAEVCSPWGVAASGATLYIADSNNRRIRKVAAGVITTVAGSGQQGYNGDNLPALSTNMDDPVGVAVDPQGRVYEVDFFEGLVRRVH